MNRGDHISILFVSATRPIFVSFLTIRCNLTTRRPESNRLASVRRVITGMDERSVVEETMMTPIFSDDGQLLLTNFVLAPRAALSITLGDGAESGENTFIVQSNQSSAPLVFQERQSAPPLGISHFAHFREIEYEKA